MLPYDCIEAYIQRLFNMQKKILINFHITTPSNPLTVTVLSLFHSIHFHQENTPL